MATPLKEMFNAAYYSGLANAVRQVHPSFRKENFLEQVLEGNEGRELNARMRHTSTVLRTHLPKSLPQTVGILKDVAPLLPRGYTALLFPDLIGVHGLDEPALSLDALRYFTEFGSSEFAVREFLRRDLVGTLQVMQRWAEDGNEHVRRLASEGCRPRLPWSFRLEAVVKDPRLTTPILEQLRADPSPYVRKSVANHLNDLSKDHPAYMLGVLRSWDREHPHTAWIAKHACRTLIKAGDPETLVLFDLDPEVQVRVDRLVVAPRRLRLGEELRLSFDLVSEAGAARSLVVDYAIHYRKAAGSTSRKVFKLKEVRLEGRQVLSIVKRQRIMDLSTRKHYPGEHIVEVQVNGNTLGAAAFELVL